MAKKQTGGLRAQREANARLERSDVIKIRQLANEYGPRTIAKAYGVGLETIRRILRGDTWDWLTEENAAVPADGAQTSLDRLLARNPEITQGIVGKAETEEENEATAKARLFGKK